MSTAELVFALVLTACLLAPPVTAALAPRLDRRAARRAFVGAVARGGAVTFIPRGTR